MTRSADKASLLQELGAEPVVCDAYEAEALREAVLAFAPDVVLHELTDLPDEERLVTELAGANVRMRREGTANLLAAARATGARRILAQSIAWEVDGERGAAKEELERSVLAAGGVVLRYGRFYGPGTYYEHAPPAPPRVHVDDAARRTVELLDAESGVVIIAEDAAA
jgi:nucleoside-diphosphate-sugar epimerase